VEFHEPLGGNASHRVSADYSAAGQLFADVRHAADIPACGIERIGVNVKPTSGFVGQDEVAFPAVIATLLAKASHAEQGAKARHLRVRQRDIEVIVRSRLRPEQRINRPATIDVHLKAILFQEHNEVGGVLLKHSFRLAAVVTR